MMIFSGSVVCVALLFASLTAVTAETKELGRCAMDAVSCSNCVERMTSALLLLCISVSMVSVSLHCVMCVLIIITPDIELITSQSAHYVLMGEYSQLMYNGSQIQCNYSTDINSSSLVQVDRIKGNDMCLTDK